MRLTKLWVLGAALTMVAAPSFAQGRGGFRGGFGGPSALLNIPEVQTELKIEPAQKDLLTAYQTQRREQLRAQFQNGGQRPDFNSPEFRQRQEAQRQEEWKKLGEILDAKQIKRLHELDIQQSGTQAVTRADVANELKLTADQKSKIDAVQTSSREAMRAAFPQGGFQNLSDADRQALGQKMQQIRTDTDSKILAVLTDAQKKQFEAMKGAAFKFPEGGFGGRRRGGNNNQ